MGVLARDQSVPAGTVAMDVPPAAELIPSWIVRVNEAVVKEPPTVVPVVGEMPEESTADMVATSMRVVTEVTHGVSEVAANSGQFIPGKVGGKKLTVAWGPTRGTRKQHLQDKQE